MSEELAKRRFWVRMNLRIRRKRSCRNFFCFFWGKTPVFVYRSINSISYDLLISPYILFPPRFCFDFALLLTIGRTPLQDLAAAAQKANIFLAFTRFPSEKYCSTSLLNCVLWILFPPCLPALASEIVIVTTAYTSRHRAVLDLLYLLWLRAVASWPSRTFTSAQNIPSLGR